MAHMISRRLLATIGIAAVMLAAVVGLTACGSSGSSSTNTSTNASATSPSGAAAGGTGAGTTTTGRPGTPGGAFASRFKAMRECLQKNGITLPNHAPGQRPRGGPGGFLGGGSAGAGGGSAGGAGGPQLPSGVTRAQYEAALKKCGGAFPRGGAGAHRFQSPAFKQALTKFASCMRENGVNIPAPDTSGNGPIFDTKGIDTASSQFRAAESKCRSDLTGAFRRPGGAPPAGGASGGEASTG